MGRNTPDDSRRPRPLWRCPGLGCGVVVMIARARATVDNYASKLERRYAVHLQALMAAGDIRGWRNESLKFRLADKTWYTPDFQVINADFSITMIEVKGIKWMDDARVKTKVAAELFPEFHWAAVTWNKLEHCWDREEFC